MKPYIISFFLEGEPQTYLQTPPRFPLQVLVGRLSNTKARSGSAHRFTTARLSIAKPASCGLSAAIGPKPRRLCILPTPIKPVQSDYKPPKPCLA